MRRNVIRIVQTYRTPRSVPPLTAPTLFYVGRSGRPRAPLAARAKTRPVRRKGKRGRRGRFRASAQVRIPKAWNGRFRYASCFPYNAGMGNPAGLPEEELQVLGVRLAPLAAAALSAALWLPAAAAAEDLTIYSSLPLVGAPAPAVQDIVRAEQLALEQSGNRAGAFPIRFVSLNDAARRTGTWTPRADGRERAARGRRTRRRSPTSASSTPAPRRSRSRSSARPGSSRSRRRTPTSG